MTWLDGIGLKNRIVIVSHVDGTGLKTSSVTAYDDGLVLDDPVSLETDPPTALAGAFLIPRDRVAGIQLLGERKETPHDPGAIDHHWLKPAVDTAQFFAREAPGISPDRVIPKAPRDVAHGRRVARGRALVHGLLTVTLARGFLFAARASDRCGALGALLAVVRSAPRGFPAPGREMRTVAVRVGGCAGVARAPWWAVVVGSVVA